MNFYQFETGEKNNKIYEFLKWNENAFQRIKKKYTSFRWYRSSTSHFIVLYLIMVQQFV